MSGAAGWLYGVTAAALLVGLIRAMMPEGRVKDVSGLMGGLLLFLVLLRPLLGMSYDAVLSTVNDWEVMTEEAAQEAQAVSGSLEGTLIEEQLRAYIVSEAGQRGIDCGVVVQCRQNEAGLWLPAEVTLEGVGSEDRPTLLTLLEDSLGLSEAQVVFREDIGKEEAGDTSPE